MFKPVVDYPTFVKQEKELAEWWYSAGIVRRYLKKNNSSKRRFSFLDGPITANNPMGVHHGWGRTYKDLWQRFYNMRGYRQRFHNGFDCQGLWVEVEVEKELGIKNKREIEELVPGDRRASIDKFVNLCKKRVYKFSRIQTEQSKRLGYFMDWDHSYYTMSDENNYMIWHFLKTCHKNGWIYKGEDSVPWCPRCQTAISQHEILTEDYRELTHQSVFFKLKIKDSRLNVDVQDVYLLVWTTTPWTIPGNVAVAVNKKYKYGLWENKKAREVLIFLYEDDRGDKPAIQVNGQKKLMEDFIFSGVENSHDYRLKKVIPAGDLLGLHYQAPFDDLPRVREAKKKNPNKFHTIIEGKELVVATEGTGLLHVAPGAGQEDFRLGKEENLPVIEIIADDATYLSGMGEFTGKNAKISPEIIIDYLRKKENGKYFFKTEKITHRYPVCWRCKTELVWKVTDEWYIAMDKPSKLKVTKNNKTLRQMMVEVAKKIHWIPEFGLDRELDWLRNMDDWLISKKNRYWGLALPIWECKSCNSFEVIGSKEELKERAVSGWEVFSGHSPHKPWIDEIKIECSACGRQISRIEPVGNPWLDAGIVPFSTITEDNRGKPLYLTDKKKWQKWFPADFITESFPGQFKNWFYSLIAMSTVLERKPPFKTVLGFATLLGEDGRPMHKSWGNAIEFNEGAAKIGVDVMRWMYVRQNPETNLLFGYKKADETRRRFHLTLWNVYNFFVVYANLHKYQPKKKVLFKPKNILDRWIYSRLSHTISSVTQSLEAYKPHLASEEIESFVQDLSKWYLRRSRERVGLEADDKIDKEDFFDCLYTVLIALSQLLAPFTPFLSEEIYRNLTGKLSVHLTDWPKASLFFQRDHNSLTEDMRLTRQICELGHAQRKKERIKVRQPLGSLKIINADKQLGSPYEKLIKDELNVKEIKWQKGKGELRAELDTKITAELRAEGEARDLIRKIQRLRKKKNCKLSEKITVVVPSYPKEFEEMIKRRTLSDRIICGERLDILRHS